MGINASFIVIMQRLNLKKDIFPFAPFLNWNENLNGEGSIFALHPSYIDARGGCVY